jgi:hypothetical protein
MNVYRKIQDYFIRQQNNQTFLSLCSEGNSENVISFVMITNIYLLDYNCRDKNNNNAILLACQYDNVELIKYLIDINIDINAVNSQQMNAYLLAAKYNNIKLIKYFTNKLNINKVNIYGYNAYIIASLNGNTNIMNYLNKYTPIDIYHTSYNGKNAFTLFRQNKRIDKYTNYYKSMIKSVHYMASNGYDVDFKECEHLYLCDIYYQLYYKLDNVDMISSNDKCNLCETKYLSGELVLVCTHNHITHVSCYVMSKEKYQNMNTSQIYNFDSCYKCREPNLLNQKNIKLINN